MPIVEPEIDIHSPEKGASRGLLKASIFDHLVPSSPPNSRSSSSFPYPTSMTSTPTSSTTPACFGFWPSRVGTAATVAGRPLARQPRGDRQLLLSAHRRIVGPSEPTRVRRRSQTFDREHLRCSPHVGPSSCQKTEDSMSADHIPSPWAIRSTLISVAELLEPPVESHNRAPGIPSGEILHDDAIAVLGGTSSESIVLILRETWGVHVRHGQQLARPPHHHLQRPNAQRSGPGRVRAAKPLTSSRPVVTSAIIWPRWSADAISTTCPSPSSATTRTSRSGPSTTRRSSI